MPRKVKTKSQASESRLLRHGLLLRYTYSDQEMESLMRVCRGSLAYSPNVHIVKPDGFPEQPEQGFLVDQRKA